MKINRFFMIQQATFLKLTDILDDYLLITAYLNSLKSKRSEKLYQELLRMSLKDNEILIPLSYEYLKKTLGYGYESIRVALWSLEKAALITKTRGRLSDSFCVELNHNFWVNYLKNLKITI